MGLGTHPTETKTDVHKMTCTKVFTAAISMTANDRNDPNRADKHSHELVTLTQRKANRQ